MGCALVQIMTETRNGATLPARQRPRISLRWRGQSVAGPMLQFDQFDRGNAVHSRYTACVPTFGNGGTVAGMFILMARLIALLIGAGIVFKKRLIRTSKGGPWALKNSCSPYLWSVSCGLRKPARLQPRGFVGREDSRLKNVRHIGDRAGWSVSHRGRGSQWRRVL